MGSAFPAEPPEWFSDADRRELVTFSLADPDWVIHRADPVRPVEYPHLASDCGRLGRPDVLPQRLQVRVVERGEP